MHLKTFAAASAALWLAAGSAGAADVGQAYDICVEGTANADVVLSACTDVIQAGTLSDKRLADVYHRRAYLRTGRGDYDGAMRDIEQSLKLNPKNLKAQGLRGNLRSFKGDHAGAIADYNAVLAQDPDNVYMLNARAVSLSYVGEPDKAIADYNRLVELKPDDATFRLNRAITFREMGDYDRAWKDLRFAEQLDGRNSRVWYVFGLTYDRMGQPDEAVKAYTKSMDLGDDEDDYALARRGAAYARLGDRTRAFADLEQLRRSAPRMDDTYIYACEARAVLNIELEQAERDCAKGIEIGGGADSYAARGRLRLAQGRLAEAWADYDRAAKKAYDNAPYIYARGVIALKMGRAAEGRVDMAQAVKLDPKVAAWAGTMGIRS